MADSHDTSRQEISISELHGKKVCTILCAGQSNSANNGETPYTSKSERVLNLFQGKLYNAKDPMLGASGDKGSPWARLGDKIIENQLYDYVIFITIGVNGAEIARWTVDGDLHGKFLNSIKEADKVGFPVNKILWHQGESDAYLNHTKKAEYVRMFEEMKKSLRHHGYSGPIYVCTASWISGFRDNPKIQAAQKEIVLNGSHDFVFAGPNTDSYGYAFRWDGTHLSKEGLDKFASDWFDCIFPERHRTSSSSGN